MLHCKNLFFLKKKNKISNNVTSGDGYECLKVLHKINVWENLVQIKKNKTTHTSSSIYNTTNKT